MTAIAIVGMACRYPDAKSPAELWENVLAGRQAFRRIPSDRLRLDDYDESIAGTDSTYVQEAALIDGFEFDRVRFKVAGSTYRAADLAHWLALDVADRAFADAGFPEGDGLDRSQVGVLIGNSLTGEMTRAQQMRLRWPYVRRVLASTLADRGWDGSDAADLLAEVEDRYKEPFAPMGEESLAGGLANTIAGRVANHFDLGGGGYTVDGACASSLLAVANACSALTAGDLDAALAGGVDVSLDPFELVGFARTGALAHGDMRVFDRRSAGFLPGEGSGFVLLMRLDDALARGARVLAVLSGWGISSDGQGGITRPEPAGQLLALRRAYGRAGRGPQEVGMFEGHGTGTAVGDEAELTALDTLRREADPAPARAVVGSIKGNIGHTKAAAGIAGTIKAIQAVRGGWLPPATGTGQPHPLLEDREDRSATLRVLERAEEWSGSQRIAGVSAMGFGGINAHIVIESPAPEPPAMPANLLRTLEAGRQDAEVFLISAVNRSAMTERLDELIAVAVGLSRAEMADLSIELMGRENAQSTMPSSTALRGSVVAKRPAELAAALRTLRELVEAAAPQTVLDIERGIFLSAATEFHRPRIGFLFPGQASPVRLGGDAWSRRFDQIDRLYQEQVGSDGALGKAALDNDPSDSPVSTHIAQPAITVASLAGIELLRRLGVEAQVAVGHSLGELAALHWAAAFDAPTLIDLAAQRGRAMASETVDDSAERTVGDTLSDPGAMASLALTAEETVDLLTELDLASEVGIAGFNAPRQIVISGATAGVDQVIDILRERGGSAVRLKVSHAFHSPRMAPALPVLRQALDGITIKPIGAAGERRALRRVVSTVTGEAIDGLDSEALRDVLCRQLSEPVRFTQALATAQEETAVDLWIEVGPGSILTGLAERCFNSSDADRAPAIALDVGSSSLAGLLQVVGATWVLGERLEIDELVRGRFVRPFPSQPKQFFTNPCEEAPAAHQPAVAAQADRSGRPAQPIQPAQPAQSTQPVDSSPRPIVVPGSPVGSDSKIAPEISKVAAEQAAEHDPGPEVDALTVVRALVAERTELPIETVHESSRMLSDLHLNSIAVGQLVAEAARRLGSPPPASPTDFADARVAELAAALSERLDRSGSAGSPESAADSTTSEEIEPAPPGIGSWIRPFAVVRQPNPPATRTVSPEASVPFQLGSLKRIGKDERNGSADSRGEPSDERTRPFGHPLVVGSSGSSGSSGSNELSAALGIASEVSIDSESAIDLAEGSGLLVLLPETRASETVDLLLGIARAAFASPSVPVAVIQPEGGGAGGFMRSLFLERTALATAATKPGAVALLEIPSTGPEVDEVGLSEELTESLTTELRALVDRQGDYVEAYFSPLGKRSEPRLEALPVADRDADRSMPIGADDVVLVTGGGRGIGAECALGLAEASGCAVALLGRSPIEQAGGGEIATNLKRFAAAGLRAIYLQADVTDEDAVGEAVKQAEANLGPITGVIHGAGLNRPCLLTALDRDHVDATLAPKIDGLEVVLSAVEPDRLRLLVALGSIIARSGMRGEADYALANEWLGLEIEHFAAEHPECLCRTIEYSVWSGVGMGERLGRIEGLRREGVTPIPPELGVRSLIDIIERRDAPLSTVVSGRFGDMATLVPARPELPFLRFLEQVRVWIPGVEAIIDCELDADSDPYLADHVFAGERLLPAVVGLEAMAQTVSALVGREVVPTFEGVSFDRPVIVPEGESVRMRVVAQMREDGRIDAVLRSAESDFQVDCFRAVCSLASEDESAAANRSQAPTASLSLGRSSLGTGKAALTLSPADLYGGMLFHSGRFRRLERYRHLNATECLADIASDGKVEWFDRTRPARFLLGDPAARDAAIHAIQACIPHATVLPLGVERLEVAYLAADQPWRVEAVETERDGRTMTYDLNVIDTEGRIVERWHGLRLRAVEITQPTAPWPTELLAPYLERRLGELVEPYCASIAVIRQAEGEERRAASDRAISAALGLATASDSTVDPAIGPTVLRRKDGKPLVALDREISVAHADDLVLAAAANGALGCDLEPVVERGEAAWRDLLGRERFRLAHELSKSLGESLEVSATRAWTIIESLKKAGLPSDAPTSLRSSDEGEGTSWALLDSGEHWLASTVTAIDGFEQPVAITLLGTRSEARSRSSERGRVHSSTEKASPERTSETSGSRSEPFTSPLPTAASGA